LLLPTQALRFKDDHGNDFPEWEDKKLGDVSQNAMYGMNAASTEYDGVTKYIRITDIDQGSNQFRPDPVTSPDQPAEDKYKLQRGDIVFARTGASVGKSYLYDEADGNLAFAGFLIRFSICEDIANPCFVFLQTLSENYWRWVKVNSMRSGQPGINAEEYKTFTFDMPSLPEQTKIANFLTALDRKIESVSQQITHTQTFKRGLLQQMFV
jgi:type I restriction enzyme, S subunit